MVTDHQEAEEEKSQGDPLPLKTNTRNELKRGGGGSGCRRGGRGGGIGVDLVDRWGMAL